MAAIWASTRTSWKKYLRSYATEARTFGPRRGDRVVVGMSGGVDSSVTAMLLAQQDFDLSAVFMRNWDTRDESGTDKGCEWEKDWEDVQRVCKTLDLPCELVDLSREYWNRVFEPSLLQWESGVTPNPDVWCNKEIKFGALLDRLSIHHYSLKDAWIATGHYARKAWHSNNGSPRPRLLQAVDKQKDQTYYLSSMSEASLNRALFPIGHLTKPEVRELAKKHSLVTAERPDSVGLCFVGERGKFSNFLSSYIRPNPGPIIDRISGKTIGQHKGLWNYTLGEKARIPGMPQKMFVESKEPVSNVVYVVPGGDHSLLYKSTLHAHNFQWIWSDHVPQGIDSTKGYRAQVMHRYRMEPVPCTVHRVPDASIIITCDEPEKSISPGQVAAIYDGDWCLGCGIIVKTEW